jgi:CTP synthase (UTP-ammonia lyase)
VTVALIGERNPQNVNHAPTEAAFARLGVAAEWVATALIQQDPSVLDAYERIMLPPAMPYASEEGALASISHARKRNTPLLGTCGGFQYAVIELARGLLGIVGAEHAETHPNGAELVVTPLVCSLVGQEHPVRIVPESLAGELYGIDRSIEPFFCSYGVSPAHRASLEAAGVRFTGFDESGEPRILELPSNDFFLATLYVPQAKQRPDPHPIITGFLEAKNAVTA